MGYYGYIIILCYSCATHNYDMSIKIAGRKNASLWRSLKLLSSHQLIKTEVLMKKSEGNRCKERAHVGRFEKTLRVNVPYLVLLWKHDSWTVYQHTTGKSSTFNEVTQIKLIFPLYQRHVFALIYNNNYAKNSHYLRSCGDQCWLLCCIDLCSLALSTFWWQ